MQGLRVAYSVFQHPRGTKGVNLGDYVGVLVPQKSLKFASPTTTLINMEWKPTCSDCAQRLLKQT